MYCKNIFLPVTKFFNKRCVFHSNSQRPPKSVIDIFLILLKIMVSCIFIFLQIKLKIGVTWFWLRFSTHSLGGPQSWTKYEKFHKMHMRWLFPGYHWHFGRSCNSQPKNWAPKKSWTCPRFQQINAKRCCRRRKTDTQGKKKKTIKRNIFLGNSRNLYMRKLSVISR